MTAWVVCSLRQTVRAANAPTPDRPGYNSRIADATTAEVHMDTQPITEPGLARVLEPLKAVLVPQETLESWAIQRRLFALTHRRIVIAATSGRFIVLTRGLLAGYRITDVRWQDLEHVSLNVGIIGADLSIRAGRGSDLALENSASQELAFRGLRKDQAQAVYRICQAQDQAWREKRRVRELEEMRAKSGGVQVLTGGAGASAAGAPPPDVVRRLQEAKQLLDAKLITDAEYEAVKAKIFAST